MSIAPKNFRKLIKRNGGKKVWFEAMLKEREQLKERGVFEFVTLADHYILMTCWKGAKTALRLTLTLWVY